MAERADQQHEILKLKTHVQIGPCPQELTQNADEKLKEH